MKDKMGYLPKYVMKYGFHMRNIIPTGNMPSVINGGLDFTNWSKNDRILYPIMKKAVEAVIGKEAVGIADVCMGENLYEKNKSTEAMGYLSKGLSDAKLKGSIRVQYAAVGIMARIFQVEGQSDTAKEILLNIHDQAKAMGSYELLPNINTSLTYCALLDGDIVRATQWLEQKAPDEYAPFLHGPLPFIHEGKGVCEHGALCGGIVHIKYIG